MDLKELKNKALSALVRHKYALVIVALGLVLMLLPMGSERGQMEKTQQTTPQQQTEDVQQALERLLSKIRGAGEVEVLLTVATGSQTIYQEDADITGGEKDSAQILRRKHLLN